MEATDRHVLVSVRDAEINGLEINSISFRIRTPAVSKMNLFPHHIVNYDGIIIVLGPVYHSYSLFKVPKWSKFLFITIDYGESN